MQAPSARNLFALLGEQAQRFPDALAVIAGEEQLTYGELAIRARAVAAGFVASGVQRGARIGMLIDNRLEFLEVAFAAAAIGATAVPFSTWSKSRELEFLIADSAIEALVFLDRVGEIDYAAVIPSVIGARAHPMKALVAIGAAPHGAHRYADFSRSRAVGTADSMIAAATRAADPRDDAFVLYTSGSTAHPKAVPLAHGSTIENGFNIGERQGLRPGDRVLVSLPLFWSYGAANALAATLTHAATLVLQRRFEAAGAIDLIERHRCTSIYTLPAVTAAILAHPSFRPERTRSLRTGLTIGTPADITAAAERLGAREICNIYGQTESYGNCCVTPHDWPLERRRLVQGPPLPGVSVRIVHPQTGQPLGSGTIGAIEVKGHLTRGYEGASRDQNQRAFTPDGYFRTGDLGLITPAGDLQFAARNSEMIKRAGINIAPAEVEEVLRQHPGVAAAGVAGAPDPDKGEIVVAFIVAAGGARPSVEELKAHCRALASSYKTPDRIEFCDALPVTDTGKLLRRALQQRAAAAIER